MPRHPLIKTCNWTLVPLNERTGIFLLTKQRKAYRLSPYIASGGFATSGNFTSNLAGENAGLIAKARSYSNFF